MPIASADQRRRRRRRRRAAAAQPLGQQLGADDRGQGDDGAGRQIDPPGDDHQRGADGEHAEEGDPVEQRLEAVRLEEGVVAIQEVDQPQDRQDARDQPPFRGLEEATRCGRRCTIVAWSVDR